MSRPSASELSRLREVRELVERVPSSGAPLPPEFTEAAHLLFESSATWSWAFLPGDRPEFSFMHTGGLQRDRVQREFERLFAQSPEGWTNYDPRRTPRAERNRVMSSAQIFSRRDRPPSGFPVHRVYETLGVDRLHSARVLVCEGPSLLAYVGIMRPDPVDATRARMLSALVPSLLRRLSLERRLQEAPRVEAALGAALEGLGAPAFILDVAGRPREMNSAGKLCLQRDRRGLSEALRDAALRGAGRSGQLELTPLRARGEPQGYLAVLRVEAPEVRLDARVQSAADALGVGPRRREILALVARGLANQTIADALGIGVRAVEAHVTALLDLAGVDSRAALVARVLQP